MNPSAGNPVVVVVGQGTNLDIVDASIDFLISTCATLSASDQHKRLNQLSQDLARLQDQKQALMRKILESNAENGEPYDPLQTSRVVVTAAPGSVLVASTTLVNTVVMTQGKDHEAECD
jgi:hypothetical protein